MRDTQSCDVLIIGASMAGASCAKRLVDAGYEVIIADRKILPRDKICSGILSPRAHQFITENFGQIPAYALHEPNAFHGAIFHYPSLTQLKMDFFGGPTPHLNRKYGDHWIIQQCGAQILSGWRFQHYEQKAKEIWVTLAGQQQKKTLVCRYLVGADGPSSSVLRQLYPDYQKSLPWFFVGNKFHKVIENPLDKDYFHFWFNQALGHYTWAHLRDTKMIVGVGFLAGGHFDNAQQNVVNYLAKNQGVILAAADPKSTEGCAENFGPSLINRFVFGQNNILITGQASGFLNMLAEGMSCALHSGAVAGESIIQANIKNQTVQSVYRTLIGYEVKRTCDQWNPLQIAFANPHEADAKLALRKLGLKKALLVLWESWKFITLYKKLHWGRQIVKNAFYRLLKGVYSSKYWR